MFQLEGRVCVIISFSLAYPWTNLGYLNVFK